MLSYQVILNHHLLLTLSHANFKCATYCYIMKIMLNAKMSNKRAPGRSLVHISQGGVKGCSENKHMAAEGSQNPYTLETQDQSGSAPGPARTKTKIWPQSDP